MLIPAYHAVTSRSARRVLARSTLLALLWAHIFCGCQLPALAGSRFGFDATSEAGSHRYKDSFEDCKMHHMWHLWKTTDSTQLNSLRPLALLPLFFRFDFSTYLTASRPKVRPKPGAPCPRILIPAVAPVGLVRPGSLPPAVPSPEVEPAAHPPARAIAGDRDREEAALPTINPSGATGEDRWKMA